MLSIASKRYLKKPSEKLTEEMFLKHLTESGDKIKRMGTTDLIYNNAVYIISLSSVLFM